MDTVMHVMMFVPAVAFCTVGGLCWGFSAMLDLIDRSAAVPHAAARPARPGFRPVVIEGGLAADGRAPGTISSFRVRQTPLGFAGAGKIHAARSYGG